jgi:uncharacterized protein (TIGR00725 family)
MNMLTKNVTVFGGSQTRPGDPAYIQALRLGQLLGKASCTVLTGGYLGTMEAVSRGVAEAGGHVIGVTCEDIERWRPVKPNAWVQEEWRCHTLGERLARLIDGCEAALALPGGPGTLTEIALTWNLLLTEAITPKPLILIGPGWQATFETFFKAFDGNIPIDQRQWLSFVVDVDAAVYELEKRE